MTSCIYINIYIDMKLGMTDVTCTGLCDAVSAHEGRFGHAAEVLLLLGVVGSDKQRGLRIDRG